MLKFPGRFLSIEGPDGSGKTSQVKNLAGHLESRGIKVVTTREPGGSPLAEAIRGVVLKDWAEGVTPMTELLLMFAARAAHLNATILPALRSGAWVISDRFVDSSHVFQGVARGMDSKHLNTLQDMVLGDLRPDLTLIFDVAPEVSRARLEARGGANRFDRETPEFMERIRRGFLSVSTFEPHRYAIIDANASLEQVRDAACAAVDRLIDA